MTTMTIQNRTCCGRSSHFWHLPQRLKALSQLPVRQRRVLRQLVQRQLPQRERRVLSHLDPPHILSWTLPYMPEHPRTLPTYSAGPSLLTCPNTRGPSQSQSVLKLHCEDAIAVACIGSVPGGRHPECHCCDPGIVKQRARRPTATTLLHFV